VPEFHAVSNRNNEMRWMLDAAGCSVAPGNPPQALIDDWHQTRENDPTGPVKICFNYDLTFYILPARLRSRSHFQLIHPGLISFDCFYSRPLRWNPLQIYGYYHQSLIIKCRIIFHPF